MRIRALNDRPGRVGSHVVYWMQSSQRALHNHALEHALAKANALGLPLRVVFGLTDRFPEATERHYGFMLEGLADVAEALARRRIAFEVRRGKPDAVALEAARGAALLVCDVGYLRVVRRWRERVAAGAGCLVEAVEDNVVVPVEAASDKAEVAARTLRPKILRLLDRYLSLPEEQPVAVPSEVAPAELPAGGGFYRGGTTEALRRFARFDPARYAGDRRHPHLDGTSGMSMHLHFGQVSPVYLALQAVDCEPFLEELVVRRELAFNHVRYRPDYDEWSCLPEWARRTLQEHRDDPREHVYAEEQLVDCATHDPYWNAAMREMRDTGWLHNHMRMYWGKKILEWTADPEEAYHTALALNNRYLLDGRDPASFANVGWLFGLHDRPWPSRPIYGTVRCMTASGLERKTDPRAWVRQVAERLRS